MVLMGMFIVEYQQHHRQNWSFSNTGMSNSRSTIAIESTTDESFQDLEQNPRGV